MSATILTIADAVVTALNGHAFATPFTAARGYVPVSDLKDLADLTVTVVPMSPLTSERESRRTWKVDYRVVVCVQKKVDTLPDDADALMTLVEEIADFFRAMVTLPGHPEWTLTGLDNDPCFEPGPLDRERTFESYLALVVREYR